jgi:hypothetical protein
MSCTCSSYVVARLRTPSQGLIRRRVRHFCAKPGFKTCFNLSVSLQEYDPAVADFEPVFEQLQPLPGSA